MIFEISSASFNKLSNFSLSTFAPIEVALLKSWSKIEKCIFSICA